MSEGKLTALNDGAARPGDIELEYIELEDIEVALPDRNTPLSNTAPLSIVPLSAAVWGDLNLGTQRLGITIGVPLVTGTLPQLSRLLLDAVLISDWPVVLDLRGVSEIDSDGLTLLLKLHKTMPIEIRPLSLLVLPGTQPARILNLSGLGNIMAVLTDLDHEER